MSDTTTKRRRAREVALQVLFQKEFVSDVDIGHSLMYFRDQLEMPEESWIYAEKLLHGIEEKKSEIDQKISDKSRNWKLSRISPVDLSLLRIGTYEICFGDPDTPPKVVINEAIEIAKRYGGVESSAFINGLLDEILRGNS